MPEKKHANKPAPNTSAPSRSQDTKPKSPPIRAGQALQELMDANPQEAARMLARCRAHLTAFASAMKVLNLPPTARIIEAIQRAVHHNLEIEQARAEVRAEIDKLQAEVAEAYRQEAEAWEKTTGRPYPKSIEKWQNQAALAGIPIDRIIKGDWTLAEMGPIIEGALERLKIQAAIPTAGTGKDASPATPGRAERVWSKPHCPSCGAPDVEWITQKEFAKRAGNMKPNTVSDRVNDGKYWTRADRCVPWCRTCQAGTPEGSGDVAPQIAYEPSPGDIDQITVWAYEALKPFGLQKHLPGINHLKGFKPDPSKYGQHLAVECLEEAIGAIYLLANDRKGLPGRDEAIKAATDAIEKKRGDDIENRKQTGHDMDRFSRPHGSGRGRRAVSEPEDTEDPAED